MGYEIRVLFMAAIFVFRESSQAMIHVIHVCYWQCAGEKKSPCGWCPHYRWSPSMDGFFGGYDPHYGQYMLIYSKLMGP